MTYANLPGQRSMALDERRNSAYEKAIAAAVTPDSAVLDLGAGIGIFGLLALKHGARHVYFVEPQDLGVLGRDIATANGWGDRVTFLQGRIEELKLPEKVDVITSAMTGNVLFHEDLLPTLFRARDDWLKSDGVLIPSAGAIDAAPVSAPDLIARHLEVWDPLHLEIDMSLGRKFSANALIIRDGGLRKAEALGPTRELFAMDFADASYEKFDATLDVPCADAGICNGIAVWLRMRLGEEWLSTGPFDPKVHWSPALVPFDPSLEVATGDVIEFRLLRPPRGDWAWRAQRGDDRREGSTFFGRPGAGIGMVGGDARPRATTRGRAVAMVVSGFDGETTVADLAERVADQFSDLFPTSKQAESFVQRMVRVHGGPASD